MNIFDALPGRFPGKGKGIPVETGKAAEGDLESVFHVFLDRLFQGQDLGFFRLGTNSWHNYLLLIIEYPLKNQSVNDLTFRFVTSFPHSWSVSSAFR